MSNRYTRIRSELVYHQIPVGEAPALNLQPRGGTALLDAMGKLITDTVAARRRWAR